MSIRAKKTENTPKNAKNNNLKNAKYQNVNEREPSFCIRLARGRLAPLPPSVTPLATQRSTKIVFPPSLLILVRSFYDDRNTYLI